MGAFKPAKLLPIILGIGILAALVLGLGVQNVVLSIKQLSLPEFLAGVVVLGVALQLRAVKSVLLLRKIYPASKAKASASFFLGQLVNDVLPGGSGELSRLVTIGAPKKQLAKVASAIFLERAMDVAALLLFALSLGIFIQAGMAEKVFYSMTAVLAVFLLVCAALWKSRALEHAPGRIHDILVDVAAKAKQSWKSFAADKKLLAITAILTLAGWFLDAAAQVLMLKAFGLEANVLFIAAVVGASWIVGIFSFLPGGVGSREVTYVFLTSTKGLNPAGVVSMALVYRLSSSAISATFFLLNKGKETAGD